MAANESAEADGLGEQPAPRVDPAPDAGPGGADVNPDEVAAAQDGQPPLVADQPTSAQVEDGEVPEGIRTPETQEESRDDKPDSSVETGSIEPAG